jgi:hypothetical protein
MSVLKRWTFRSISNSWIALVVEEEDALADTPERRRPELEAVGVALGNAVCEHSTHIVQGEIAKRLERLVAHPAYQIFGSSG